MKRPDYEARIRYLERLIGEKRAALLNSKGEMIKIEHKQNSTQYFVRKNSKDKNGTYLPADQALRAFDIVQENYDREVLKKAVVELDYLRKSQAGYPHKVVEDIYPSLSDERQEMVRPIVLTDEQLVTRFLSLEYEPLGFREDDTTEFYLRDGTRVRSKSELLLGDELLLEEVPCHYEYPLKLSGGRTVRPDFYVLNVRTRKVYYWEHLGRLDDKDYVNRNLVKLQQYEDSGIYVGEKLIVTAETKERPLSMKTVRKMIEKYLK